MFDNLVIAIFLALGWELCTFGTRQSYHIDLSHMSQLRELYIELYCQYFVRFSSLLLPFVVLSRISYSKEQILDIGTQATEVIL